MGGHSFWSRFTDALSGRLPWSDRASVKIVAFPSLTVRQLCRCRLGRERHGLWTKAKPLVVLPHLAGGFAVSEPRVRPFPNFSGTVRPIRRADLRLRHTPDQSTDGVMTSELGPGSNAGAFCLKTRPFRTFGLCITGGTSRELALSVALQSVNFCSRVLRAKVAIGGI